MCFKVEIKIKLEVLIKAPTKNGAIYRIAEKSLVS